MHNSCSGCVDFSELDGEISQYEAAMLRIGGEQELNKNNHKSRPLLKRFLSTLLSSSFRRPSISEEVGDTLPPLPDPPHHRSSTDGTITCRLCEMPITCASIERHTTWCSQIQDCTIKRSHCHNNLLLLAHALAQMSVVSSEANAGTGEGQIQDALMAKIQACVHRSLLVDEQEDKGASTKLAKLQYKLCKIDIRPLKNQTALASMIKRLKYLIEQKRILAERLMDLMPAKQSHYDSLSTTDSSLASTPRRPTTPVSKLTTLFSALLGHAGRSRSKSPIFGSPPRMPGPLGPRSQEPFPKITDFEIIKPISRGAYGNVFLAMKKATSDLYAIKALKKSEMIRKNMISHVLAEKKVMEVASTPFVVRLFYAFQSNDYLYLVMEYLIGGDLSSILQKQGRLSPQEAKFYTAELILALEYLHEQGIVHRDIKPDNMLLDEEGHLKLTDFGLANTTSTVLSSASSSKSAESEVDRYITTLLGTPDYLAPELLRNMEHGPAVDWWAVGVCLFEFLVGMPPFCGESAAEIFNNILNFNKIDWAPLESVGVSAEARSFIDKLLDPDPNSRLSSAKTIKKHPFVSDIDWFRIRDLPAPLKPKPRDSVDTSCFEARNQRYGMFELPEDLSKAEAVGVQNTYELMVTSSAGPGTPTKASSLFRRPSSPFDGFMYKNIDLLSRVNRKLSATPMQFDLPSRSERNFTGAI